MDDEHRRPGKNGKDQSQDRDIRDLRQQFADWRSDESKWRQADEETHRHLIRSVTRQNVLIGIASGIFALFVGWLSALWAKIDNVEERLETKIEARVDVIREKHDADQRRNDAHSTMGERWGAELEKQIQENRQEIRELRRRRTTSSGKD